MSLSRMESLVMEEKTTEKAVYIRKRILSQVDLKRDGLTTSMNAPATLIALYGVPCWWQ